MAGQRGVDRRAQMDAATVKALLVANGGAAAALLAFVPTILGKPDYEPLVRGVLVSMGVLMGGFVFAVIHNICLRNCSLHYEHHHMHPPKGKLLGIPLWEPTICAIGTCFKWLSLVAFVGAVVYVAYIGIVTVLNKAPGA